MDNLVSFLVHHFHRDGEVVEALKGLLTRNISPENGDIVRNKVIENPVTYELGY